MGTGRDDLGDLREVQIHRLGVAVRQDQGRPFALFRADRTEDVGGGGALVPGRAGTGTALGPAAGDLVLLADTSFVCEPYFYLVAVDRLLARDCIQARGEVFLKSSITPSETWYKLFFSRGAMSLAPATPSRTSGTMATAKALD
jgi:hypothetical protein